MHKQVIPKTMFTVFVFFAPQFAIEMSWRMHIWDFSLLLNLWISFDIMVCKKCVCDSFLIRLFIQFVFTHKIRAQNVDARFHLHSLKFIRRSGRAREKKLSAPQTTLHSKSLCLNKVAQIWRIYTSVSLVVDFSQ